MALSRIEGREDHNVSGRLATNGGFPQLWHDLLYAQLSERKLSMLWTDRGLGPPPQEFGAILFQNSATFTVNIKIHVITMRLPSFKNSLDTCICATEVLPIRKQFSKCKI
jgi:hypothetical protein